jgi:hypothetical protein
MIKYITILFCFLSVWLFGQDAKVTLQASKNEVAVGEKFTVTLTANTKGEGSIKLPEGLEMLASMNGSSSQSINGKKSYEATLTLTVVANRTGTFTIPPAIWKHGMAKKTKSNALTITVKNKPSGDNGSSSLQTSPQPEANGKHFAVFSTNKKEVYVGEPFVISGRIYFDGHIVDANTIKLYENDLMVHKTDVAGNNGALNVTGEQFNGRMYESILLFEELIVPQQSGKLSFDAFSINVGYQKGFFGKGFKNLISNALQVNVLPLPNDAPVGFQGALGRYNIKSSNDIKGPLEAGAVFTYKVRVEGSGNIHMLKPLTLNLPKGLILYGDPLIDNQVFTTKKGAHGHIDYEFIVQVQNGGNYDFIPFEFAYFNPEAKTFNQIDVPQISFEASGNELTDERNEFNETEIKSSYAWWKYITFGTMALGTMAGVIIFFLKKNKLSNEEKKSKKQKVDARAVALKSLEALPASNLSETADALEKILLQYFRNLSQNDDLLLDKAWFGEEAQKFNISPDVAASWSEHFDSIQAIKYAGYGLKSAEDLVRNTIKLVG